MPVNLNANNFSTAAHQVANQQAAPQTAQNTRAVDTAVSSWKHVGQSIIETKATNKSAMVGSFKTARSNQILQRSRLALNLRQSQQVLSDRHSLSEAARQDMERIKSLELGAYPATKSLIDEMSRASLGRYSHGEISDLAEALNDYRGDNGDNILMNIHAKGHPSLEHYLQSIDSDYRDPQTLRDYVEAFADHFSCLTGMESEDEELDELQSRIEDRLQEPVRDLIQHLSSVPKLSAVPLLRGSVGREDPMHSTEGTLHSMLEGDSLYFNGFLSTTSSFEAAMDFTGKLSSTGFGNPLYTIDLTSNEPHNEILRRDAIRSLERGECHESSKSILYLMKTSNVAAISVNATERAANPNSDRGHAMSKEDEILLAPGHVFHPELIIRHDDGFAVIGVVQASA